MKIASAKQNIWNKNYYWFWHDPWEVLKMNCSYVEEDIVPSTVCVHWREKNKNSLVIWDN